MWILSEQSPQRLYVFATSKPGKSKKAAAELLDLVILSGCASSTVISNAEKTAFAAELTEKCLLKLKSLVKSRGVEELATIKLCSGPYNSMDGLLRVAGKTPFRVFFREKTDAFKVLGSMSHRSDISVEVFDGFALLCTEKLL